MLRRSLRRLGRLSWPVWLVALLATAWIADRSRLTPACLAEPRGERGVRIARIVDGDTFVDHCQRRLRLVGVDTPESDTPWGPVATAFAREWIESRGNRVRLLHCDALPHDHYERLLVRIQGRDGRDLARDLLEAGLAWPLHLPPCGTPWRRDDRTSLGEAQTAGTGMWSGWDPTPVTPSRAGHARGYQRVRGRIQTRREQTAQLRLSLVDEGAAAQAGSGPASRIRVDLRGDARQIHGDLQAGDLIVVEGLLRERGEARLLVVDPAALSRLDRGSPGTSR